MSLATPKAYLLDMDGVLYHGEHVLAGATTFVNALDQPIRFITNNPIRTPPQIAERLQKMGFNQVRTEHIFTSAMATRQYLEQQKHRFRFYSIGAPGLRTELTKSGTFAEHQVDFVVVGEGPGLTYESLSKAINLILQEQAVLVGTNPDLTVDAIIDGQHQVLPGGGALIAPIVAATGVTPVIIGKPQPLLYQMALENLQLPAQHCLMIGDQPETDIHGAAQLGIQTALVRTGRFSASSLYPSHCHQPDWDGNSLTDLGTALAKLRSNDRG